MKNLLIKIWLFFFKIFHKEDYLLINSWLDNLEKEQKKVK